MTLSRWRRVATGIAAGVIVLSAALLGASFRDDTSGVSVASDLRPSTIIEVPEDDAESTSVLTDDAGDSDAVTVIEAENLPDTPDTADSDTSTTPESDDESNTATEDTATEDAVSDDTATEDTATDGTATEDTATDGTVSDDTATDDTATEDTVSDDIATEDTATEDTATPAAPLTATDDALGTGGGVDDAECALDRLVIYAGARVGGVAGNIRNALAQAGFAAGCPAPVTVLASNCPLQFAGVLGAGSGYDPAKPFVAASPSVDRETMTAVMGTVGYSGSEIDILDFSFINADKPGEQWMAIFIPPSFTGWETLASRAGVSATTRSLCAPSGELAG